MKILVEEDFAILYFTSRTGNCVHIYTTPVLLIGKLCEKKELHDPLNFVLFLTNDVEYVMMYFRIRILEIIFPYIQ